MKKNYCLDWLLFLSGLACIATGLLLDFHLIPGGREAKGPFVTVHTYSGYLMAVGILLHLVWHKSWISAITKKICLTYSPRLKPGDSGSLGIASLALAKAGLTSPPATDDTPTVS